MWTLLAGKSATRGINYPGPLVELLSLGCPTLGFVQ